MPLVKNLRDYAVDVDVFDVEGTRVIERGQRTVEAGGTIDVPDACANGAPQFGRGGLLDQPANWTVADGNAARAPKPTADAPSADEE